MKAWGIGAIFSISLILIVGMPSSAFAESSDGSKSCPFKGDKSDYEKSGVDYSKTEKSDKLTATSTEQLPNWLKSNAGWWASGQLPDSEFASGIKFLIDQNFISISNTEVAQTSSSDLHNSQWVKTTAGWWADGLVSDTEFVSGLEYLVNIGVI